MTIPNQHGEMMNFAEARAAEQELLVRTYDRNPVMFASGQGVRLRDVEGNDYLDLLSGIGVCALGYNHPAITAAINEQASKLLHTSNLFFHEGTAPLAMKLTEITGMDRVFFCNSGTEAWEAAMKLARSHAELLRSEDKQIGTRFIAMEHSFHGRTMGSVATTHKAKYRDPFAPLVPGVDFVPLNDIDALRSAFSTETCAICIEVLQGEGGIHAASPEFLAAARELCDSTGALLLLDEIQSGMGRTGKWCAYQHYNVMPDVTTLAKPIAGGLPMGAMLCTDEAARGFTPGMHGSTFGGGPLACAVASAVIDAIENDNLLAHVTTVGEYFTAALHTLKAKHDSITEVRGIGFMLGLEIASSEVATDAAKAMLDRHIILNRTSETVLRFLPPFLLTTADVDEAIAALDTVMTEVEQKHALLADEQSNGK